MTRTRDVCLKERLRLQLGRQVVPPIRDKKLFQGGSPPAKFILLISAVIHLIFFTACRNRNSSNSDIKYLLLDNEPVLLRAMTFSETIKVCWTYDKHPLLEGRISSLLDEQKKAILMWRKALLPLSGRDLAQNIEFVNGCKNGHLDIEFLWQMGASEETHKHFRGSSHIAYRLATPKRLEMTFPHETGHAFGLDDTYTYNTDNNGCVKGQPAGSLMCCKSETLQLDDRRGIRFIFWMHFPDQVKPDVATKLMQVAGEPLSKQTQMRARRVQLIDEQTNIFNELFDYSLYDRENSKLFAPDITAKIKELNKQMQLLMTESERLQPATREFFVSFVETLLQSKLYMSEAFLLGSPTRYLETLERAKKERDGIQMNSEDVKRNFEISLEAYRRIREDISLRQKIESIANDIAFLQAQNEFVTSEQHDRRRTLLSRQAEIKQELSINRDELDGIIETLRVIADPILDQVDLSK